MAFIFQMSVKLNPKIINHIMHVPSRAVLTKTKLPQMNIIPTSLTTAYL